jgi:hypothetical protein
MPRFWKPLKFRRGKIEEIGWLETLDPTSLGSGTPTSSTYLRGDGTWSIIDSAPTSLEDTMIKGTTTVDFGSEQDSAEVVITSTMIDDTKIKAVTFIPVETTATSLDDFKLNGVSFSIQNIINTTSFTIRGVASNNASGIYTIKYIICQQQ